jgi:hypothetical protein
MEKIIGGFYEETIILHRFSALPCNSVYMGRRRRGIGKR